MEIPFRLDPLAHLRDLRSLALVGCLAVDLRTVADLPHLTTLEVYGTASMRNLAFLAKLSRLVGLTIEGAGPLFEDFSAIGQLTRLQRLRLKQCERLVDLAPCDDDRRRASPVASGRVAHAHAVAAASIQLRAISSWPCGSGCTPSQIQ